ncbi:MAG: histidine phosphatase family protein, partial [Anaerolineae bacterium]|nr:histidine phosphatase family protein [Anaerolineae bacterium]
MKPNRIILIRHGESEGNVDREQYGKIPDFSLNLTKKGIDQARKAGAEIKNIIGAETVGVYLSPFYRTRQTLKYLRENIEENITSASED